MSLAGKNFEVQVSEVVMYRHTRSAIIATATIAAAFLFAAPAWAQRGQGGGKGKQLTQQRSEQQRSEQQRGAQSRQSDNRQGDVRQDVQRPPAQQQGQRPQVQAPPPARAQGAPAGRQQYQQPYYGPPYNNGNGRGYGWGRAYGPTYRQPVFVQPYYYFRPRTTLSFGFHIGYGVAYPWSYWDPYGPYNYGIAVRPGYNVRNYYGRVGGVSFDVQPWGASVYVDGRYVGVAADFGPSQMPLTLPAGKHKVEFRCDGYRTARFDVHVVAGQVVPYQGAMPYAR